MKREFFDVGDEIEALHEKHMRACDWSFLFDGEFAKIKKEILEAGGWTVEEYDEENARRRKAFFDAGHLE